MSGDAVSFLTFGVGKIPILWVEMVQEVTYQKTVGPHQNQACINTWHPAGRGDISPLKAQVLYACSTKPLLEKHIPILAVALGTQPESIFNALQNLIASQLLLRCITLTGDSFVVATIGRSVLQTIASRKPEIITMTETLLTKNLSQN